MNAPGGPPSDIADDLSPALAVLRTRMEELGWSAPGSERCALAEPPPRVALIAGSGLGGLSRLMKPDARIGFEELPGLAPPAGGDGVEGHALVWLIGESGGTPIHLISGRRHLYEGIEPRTSVMTVRLLAWLGVSQIILLNAAGGLVPRLAPGDLMLIRDHLNLTFRDPLRGLGGAESDNPFHSHRATSIYDPRLQSALREAARETRAPLAEGIYAAVAGPSYETRAEVSMLRRLGADAVGMSTAPEASAARRAGIRVAGLSVITNSHCGDGAPPPTHEEVLRAAADAETRVVRLLTAALPEILRQASAGGTG